MTEKENIVFDDLSKILVKSNLTLKEALNVIDELKEYVDYRIVKNNLPGVGNE